MQAYKFRFYPSLAQRRQLQIEFDCARYVWSWALAVRTEAYKKNKENLNAVALSRELTLLKRSKLFLARASSESLMTVLWDQDEAFKKFFRRESKYPKFKKKRGVSSSCYGLTGRQHSERFNPEDKSIKLTKLGNCKIVWTHEVPRSKFYKATISKNSTGEYYISVNCEVLRGIPEPG